MYALNINNKSVILSKRVSVLEACRQVGIEIPRYCYHESLSVAGNCRMCVVELKNSPKPLIACATPIANGMVIFTDSPLVKKARESTLEFLLLNHPLDCPICDQGGECDLQDQAFNFGSDTNRFYSLKRAVKDKNLGPIIKTVMTRCIHCTRCVRFASEIAGVSDLGTFGRGTHTEIGTYVNKVFNSELSGNLIDLCPVGALTGKPYPFVSRSWELKTFKTIDFTDSFGEDINVLIKNNRIIKILPYFSKVSGNQWISDKARFAFEDVLSITPRSPRLEITHNSSNSLKINKLSWEKLFKEIVTTIYFIDYLGNFVSSKVLNTLNITLIINSSLSMETLTSLMMLEKKYFFIKIRQLEKMHIDTDFETNYSLDNHLEQKIEESDFCLLIGLNSRYESPALNQKLRKKYQSGTFKIASIGSYSGLTFPAQSISLNNLVDIAEGCHPLCTQLTIAKNPLILVGANVQKRNDGVSLTKLFNIINKVTNITPNNLIFYSRNTMGHMNLNLIKYVTATDLKKSNVLFFMDTSLSNDVINNLLEICLLKKLVFEKNKILVDLTSRQKFNPSAYTSYLELPFKFYFHNHNFYEESGVYCNNLGNYRKTIKILSPTDKSKKTLQIIRGLNFYLSKIRYLNKNNFSKNYFDLEDLKLNQYTGLHYLPNFELNFLFSFTASTVINKKQTSKVNEHQIVKLYKSKLTHKVDDFYLENFNTTNQGVNTLTNCSNHYRNNSTNFNLTIN